VWQLTQQILIDPEGQQNRYEQTDFIVKKLKVMARTLNLPIILVVNLSRNYDRRAENTGSNTIPRLSDLRDSGTIEEDADVIIFLHEDKGDPFNENTNSFKKSNDELREYSSKLVQVILDKHRNGLTGTIELFYLKEYSKFLNVNPCEDENK